jgi:hypothetical protein
MKKMRELQCVCAHANDGRADPSGTTAALQEQAQLRLQELGAAAGMRCASAETRTPRGTAAVVPSGPEGAPLSPAAAAAAAAAASLPAVGPLGLMDDPVARPPRPAAVTPLAAGGLEAIESPRCSGADD